MKSIFQKDYDLGFIDDHMIGLVKTEKENPTVRVLAFVGIAVLIAAWILLA